jgi:ABC-type lipoprotein release transport system permease subunit
VAQAFIRHSRRSSSSKTDFLSSQLYQVKATDALTFAVVPLLLILIAGCAAFPARSAVRTNPMLALRQD